MFSRLWEGLLSLLFPPLCELCGIPSPVSTPYVGVCERCESAVSAIPRPHCAACGRTNRLGGATCGVCPNERFHFDRASAYSVYDGAMKELLHLHKFGRKKSLSRFFEKKIADWLQSEQSPAAFDAVLAMPGDPGRLRERGFNPSSRLARAAADYLCIRDWSGKLARPVSRTPQSLLGRQARRANVEGCFEVRDRGRELHGKRVLLIDDILTTGYTASECAKALKSAGAAEVAVLALARGA